MTSVQVKLDNLDIFKPLVVVYRLSDLYWTAVGNIVNIFVVN